MIHNKFSKLLIVLNIIIYFSNCQLKIPLKYFPYYKYNDSTPSTIFLGLVKQQLYANIEIGTPKRTIQIPLVFDSNDFYIADSPKKEYPSDRFNDLMFYNSTSSSSLMNSIAVSRVIMRGGTNFIASSLPVDLTAVIFLFLIGLTVISIFLLDTPIIMPS